MFKSPNSSVSIISAELFSSIVLFSPFSNSRVIGSTLFTAIFN
nr:MAG TPA: hypothetical protein [Caudoviricetes sp.]